MTALARMPSNMQRVSPGLYRSPGGQLQRAPQPMPQQQMIPPSAYGMIGAGQMPGVQPLSQMPRVPDMPQASGAINPNMNWQQMLNQRPMPR